MVQRADDEDDEIYDDYDDDDETYDDDDDNDDAWLSMLTVMLMLIMQHMEVLVRMALMILTKQTKNTKGFQYMEKGPKFTSLNFCSRSPLRFSSSSNTFLNWSYFLVECSARSRSFSSCKEHHEKLLLAPW